MKINTIKDLLKSKYNLSNPEILSKFETRGKRQAFLVVDNDKKFVLKLLEINIMQLRKRVKAQADLSRLGFPCQKIIADIDDNIVSVVGDKQLVLSEYIEGIESTPNDQFFVRLGEIAAELHSIDTANFDLPNYDNNREIERIKKLLAKSKITSEMKDLVLTTLSKLPDFSLIKQTLLHQDMSFFNVIESPDRSYLIDFDDLCVGSYTFDLGYIIAYVCTFIPWDFDKFPNLPKSNKVILQKEWLKLFITAYKKNRKIEDKDFSYIYEATIMTCLKNIFADQTNGVIMWNYKRYLEIIKNKTIILSILKG